MKDLEQALTRPVTRIEFEIAGAGVRWNLFDGDERTFSLEADADQLDELLEASGVIVQTQLGVMPAFLQEELRAHHDARQPSPN